MIDRDGEPQRFMYFVGRTDDWIRKDGENFLADPIEEERGEDAFKPFNQADYERVRETFDRAGRPIDLS